MTSIIDSLVKQNHAVLFRQREGENYKDCMFRNGAKAGIIATEKYAVAMLVIGVFMGKFLF